MQGTVCDFRWACSSKLAHTLLLFKTAYRMKEIDIVRYNRDGEKEKAI